jgi:hypothetical protein
MTFSLVILPTFAAYAAISLPKDITSNEISNENFMPPDKGRMEA